MAGAGGRLAFHAIAALLAIPVGKLVRKSSKHALAAINPDRRPTDPKRVDTRGRDALLTAGITGVATAATSLLATKGADTVWRAVTGSPPPAPKPKKVKKAKHSSSQGRGASASPA